MSNALSQQKVADMIAARQRQASRLRSFAHTLRAQAAMEDTIASELEEEARQLTLSLLAMLPSPALGKAAME